MTMFGRNDIQQKVISLTMPIIEGAINSLYCSIHPRSLAIADLGCSSGPNTFFVVSEIIKSVEKLCRELNHPSSEYQIFMNDLPGNDFNSIFKSLGSFKQKLSNEMQAKIGPCYIAGVPGSFYDRIFPNKSLHFVHSSYSLHWLSQVPEGIENNKGNIYITGTSPANVLNAYYEQFQRDFSSFLKCRAEELVDGGCMVLTLLGRRSEDPTSKESTGYIYELLATALNHLVLKACLIQGLIEADQVDAFNIPNYTPSPSEVKLEIWKEGSFTINRLEVSAIHWNQCGNELSLPKQFAGSAYNVAGCIRAVLEPLLLNHFGEAIIDEAFWLFQELIADSMSKEKTELINVTIYLTTRA